ncbi:MAG: acyl-CoA dehydrogenase [Betaproteobacteria bacterium]|nr:acyl-CoA dehydrogenase [Betaproteobacteria bacterium]
MSDYRAPLLDMRFVLRHLAGIGQWATLPGHGDFSVEMADTVLEEAAKFASEVLAPLNQVGDRQGARFERGKVITSPGFKEAYAGLVEGGWVALECDPAWGGQGLPKTLGAAVSEMWVAANIAFTMSFALSEGAIQAVVQVGSDALKRIYLPKLVSGEWSGTMNLTEPQAGSDLSLIRTRAEPRADGSYGIFGGKMFISFGEHDMSANIVHLVLARIDGAPAGTRGLSLFLAPKFIPDGEGRPGAQNDIRCVSIENKMGLHASPTCVMAWGDRGGATAYLVGEANQGLAIMFHMMNAARFACALQGPALAERAYQRALAFAKQRVQGRDVAGGEGSVPIIRHGDVRRMLMMMKARTEAMRALCYAVAAMHDTAAGHPDEKERKRARRMVDLLTPVIKGWCTEGGIEVASMGIQIHGGVGYIEETGAAQDLRDARITSIFEGTTGIQAADLAGRKIARDAGAALIELIGEIESCQREISKIKGDDFVLIARMLGEGIEALRKGGVYIAANFGDHPKQVLAGSVPFLELTGRVCGGWQMARAALAARDCLDRGEGDARFMRAKIVTARFFADQVLCAAPSLAHAACEGAAATLTLDEDQF